MCRKMCALLQATGTVAYWRFVQTYRNWADGPSRGRPIQLAIEDGSIPPRSRLQWRGLDTESGSPEVYHSSRSSS